MLTKRMFLAGAVSMAAGVAVQAEAAGRAKMVLS
jgi:hypothetical protein